MLMCKHQASDKIIKHKPTMCYVLNCVFTCRNLLVVAVFYALPVVELVITYQKVWSGIFSSDKLSGL